MQGNHPFIQHAMPLSVTIFDDFITPEALRSLRDFCLESTIFFNHITTRFVSGKLHSGFSYSSFRRRQGHNVMTARCFIAFGAVPGTRRAI